MASKLPSEVPDQPRDIIFAGLDISADPHPDECYLKLFQAAKREKIAVKIYGFEYGLLSKLSYVKKADRVEWITGHIWRFVHIDKSSPWINLSTEEEVDAEEKKEKLSIPGDWAPNSRRIFWAFNIKEHLLVFVRKNSAYSLSPTQAERFFRVLMSAAIPHVKGVDTVEVNTYKSQEKIAEIFRKSVARLEITIERPNADGVDDAYKRVVERMRKTNVRKKTETYVAPPNKSIKPDEQMKDDLEASKRSGRVKAVVYDDAGVREEVDTKNHPQEEKHQYDPKTSPAFLDFILEKAKEFLLSVAVGKK